MYLMRLTYYSHNKIVEQGAKQTEELKAILAACSRNNPNDGISGALLFSKSHFAQILEGDRKAVTSTFCRIAQDPRHSDIVILKAAPIDERTFTNWAMTFAGQSDTADSLYNKYSPLPKFNPAKMTARSLEGLIEELVANDVNVAKARAQTR